MCFLKRPVLVHKALIGLQNASFFLYLSVDDQLGAGLQGNARVSCGPFTLSGTYLGATVIDIEHHAILQRLDEKETVLGKARHVL